MTGLNPPIKLNNLPSHIFDHPDLNDSFDEVIKVGEFLVFASRLVIELKIGRCTMEELVNSKNQYASCLASLICTDSKLLEKIAPFGETFFNKRTESLIKELYS